MTDSSSTSIIVRPLSRITTIGGVHTAQGMWRSCVWNAVTVSALTQASGREFHLGTVLTKNECLYWAVCDRMCLNLIVVRGWVLCLNHNKEDYYDVIIHRSRPDPPIKHQLDTIEHDPQHMARSRTCSGPQWMVSECGPMWFWRTLNQGKTNDRPVNYTKKFTQLTTHA